MIIELGSEIGYLALAVLLAAVIGSEREWNGNDAGLRTHILVCLGSCLIMILSKRIEGADTARLAAQVVSGIGFLGAGAILKTKDSIKGLTTAGSLWACAGIGLACGAGEIVLATATTILIMFSLLVLKRWEVFIGGRK